MIRDAERSNTKILVSTILRGIRLLHVEVKRDAAKAKPEGFLKELGHAG